MASSEATVQYVVDQSGLAGALTYRRMFGEYALYLQGKVVGLVCDDTVYLKPTAEGKALAPRAGEGPPYPGAKPHVRLGEELDDRDLLRRLLRATAAALPSPVTKAKRAGKGVRRSVA